MAFKLTYSDGQESQHGDDTVWELDDGVLKLGREKGKWSVLLSPSHWAVLELGGESKDGDDDKKDSDSDKKDEDVKKDTAEKDVEKRDTAEKDTENKDDDKKDSDDD